MNLIAPKLNNYYRFFSLNVLKLDVNEAILPMANGGKPHPYSFFGHSKMTFYNANVKDEDYYIFFEETDCTIVFEHIVYPSMHYRTHLLAKKEIPKETLHRKI